MLTKLIVLATLLTTFYNPIFGQQRVPELPKAATGYAKRRPSNLNDGYYKNPVIHADYSDPDVIRVGSDYYLVSSSFEDMPGLPVLHSRDLVHWEIIGHALQRQLPHDHFSIPRHGEGVWAPSIRYYNQTYYIYYPDPDFGIYLVTAKKPEGPWSKPVLVAGGKGLIDPCPLIDDNGSWYLVHGFAGSRAGVKSIIAVCKLTADGTKILEDSRIVYDGHEKDPTIEGPKFYKRNGYYYIFAPAGGVSTGWQLALRSKNIYGPYERKVVMDQGKSGINGPHQGAWVTTPAGEDWFLHFQDKGPYGRVVHLQPMQWKKNWPVIGKDVDGDGKGEPVLTYRKPITNERISAVAPAESDEFDKIRLGLQWQWMANPKTVWYFADGGSGNLRLYSDRLPDDAKNLWCAPNVLLQKFPAEAFTVTTKVSFHPNPRLQNEKTGLAVMGLSYAALALTSRKDGLYLIVSRCIDAYLGKPEEETEIVKLPTQNLLLRVQVSPGGNCQFSYSTDGIDFKQAGGSFKAVPGRWKGAKVGLFCTREQSVNDSGYADFDWFRISQ